MFNKLHLSLLFITITILSAFIFLHFLPKRIYAASWVTSIIDGEGDVGYDNSITKDISDNYIVSYSDDENNDLKFAKSADRGATWNLSTIDSSGNVGHNNSLTVDVLGNYLISYSDNTNSDLKFAKSTNGGTSWTKSIIDNNCLVGPGTSIASDLLNNYLICYHDYANGDLKFAKSTNGGTSWTKSIVDSDGVVGENCSIIKDLVGDYLISHYDLTNRDLKFAKSTNGGTSWTKSIIDGNDSVGQYSSIAVDPLNNYLVSYFNSTSNSTMYAKSTNQGESWDTSTIDNNSGSQTNIVAISQDNYLILYASTSLVLAKTINGGDEWSTEIVDNTQGNRSSLVVDTQGNYLISSYFFDGDYGDLKFAKYEVPTPTFTSTPTPTSIPGPTSTPAPGPSSTPTTRLILTSTPTVSLVLGLYEEVPTEFPTVSPPFPSRGATPSPVMPSKSEGGFSVESIAKTLESFRTSVTSNPITKVTVRTSSFVSKASIIIPAVVILSQTFISLLSLFQFLFTLNRNIFSSLLLTLSAFWQWFLGLFLFPFWRRKRKNIGTVFDALSLSPIPQAFIVVYSRSGNIKVATTDSYGQFQVGLPEDEYQIRAEKAGYLFPSQLVSTIKAKIYTNIYEPTKKILIRKDLFFNTSVPMDPQVEGVVHKTFSFISQFNRILLPLSFLLSLYVFIIYPSFVNGVFLGGVGVYLVVKFKT